MLINLTDVLTNEGKKQEVKVDLPFKSFRYGGEEYIVAKCPQIAFIFTNIGRHRVLVQGRSLIDLQAVCSRCLQTVTAAVELDFTHEVTGGETVKAAGSSTGVPDNPDVVIDDENFISGYELNADELILHELLLAVPTKILCREDCRGLCFVCGQNLNEKECGCDRLIPDPRWSGLQLFNAELINPEGPDNALDKQN